MLKNLKIRTKLVTSFAIVVVIMVIAMIFSITNLQKLSGNMQYYVDNAVPTINAMWSARTSMVSIERQMYKAAATADVQKTIEYIQKAQEELDQISDDIIPILREKYTGDKENIEKYVDIMQNSSLVKEKMFEFLRNGQNAEGLEILQSTYVVELENGNVLLTELAADVQRIANDFAAEAEKTNSVANTLLIILTIFSIVVSIIICVLITKVITLPLNEIKFAASEMSQGNLKVNIDYESHDEMGMVCSSLRHTINTLSEYISEIEMQLGEIAKGNFNIDIQTNFKGDFISLGDSMKEIIISLSDTMSQINQSADQVSSGSDQVSGGAQALSQGATEQASSVQELAATINDISNQVRKNAENAEQAKIISDQSRVQVEKGNEEMQHMISAMNEISETSNQIGKIIKTIEDIARQTNILALNAAVEAARAGSAGMGFAVVAEEVRNLAGKSAEAAKNTTLLIEGSIKAVENGTKMADDTAKSLFTIVETTKQSTMLVNQIAIASEEQAASISQVTQGVEQISSVVQTNSATAEESAAASQELSGQASILKDLVSKFKVKVTENINSTNDIEVNNTYDYTSESEYNYTPNIKSKRNNSSNKY